LHLLYQAGRRGKKGRDFLEKNSLEAVFDQPAQGELRESHFFEATPSVERKSLLLQEKRERAEDAVRGGKNANHRSRTWETGLFHFQIEPRSGKKHFVKKKKKKEEGQLD